MTIEALVDETVMEHLSIYQTIRNMDPFAQHMLKTSQHPIMRFRRDWMRREALRQVLEAEAHQKKLSSTLAKIPQHNGSIRQEGTVSPYYAEDIERRHKAELNDKDFLKFVKREEPSMFPRRD